MIRKADLGIQNPSDWTKEELYTNLQAAVDLEFWTIPLYLTALYSIKDLDGKHPENYPDVAKLIESVVIEEMLHLQLACNLCNALGYSPQINMPVYSDVQGIPFVKRSIPKKYRRYHVRLGGLDINQLKLFCAIELPEPKTDPDWSQLKNYNSIGELYQALEIAVKYLWQELYVGEDKSKQISFFDDYPSKYQVKPGRFGQDICDLDSALAAMHAIVDQGEGNTSGVVPGSDQPDPNDTDSGAYDPAESHFVKFDKILDDLLNNRSIPAVYPVIANPDPNQLKNQTAAIHALRNYFAALTCQIQTIFRMGPPVPDPFFGYMAGIQGYITAVWQSGAVPSFTPPSTKPGL